MSNQQQSSIPIAAGAAAGKWSSLNPPLSKGTIRCLKRVFNFKQMTPVQAAVIPLFMSNKDVAVEVCFF
jgi:ATP-dependent RNA helicase DDX55/SPB4